MKKESTKLEIPDYFLQALSKDKSADEIFQKLSPSHQREYVQWIEDAKAEKAKETRITKTLEMLKNKVEKLENT